MSALSLHTESTDSMIIVCGNKNMESTNPE